MLRLCAKDVKGEGVRKRAGKVSEGEFFLSGVGGVVFVREGGGCWYCIGGHASMYSSRYRYEMRWYSIVPLAFSVVAE